MADRSPKELVDLLTLCQVPGVGNARFAALMEAFGSPSAALGAGIAELENVSGISSGVAVAIAAAQASDDVRRQADRILGAGVVVLACTEPDYPSQLAEVDDAPALLFVKGDAGLLGLPGVAVVGTRRPSEYGALVTRGLVRRLVERGVTIISGMARGVDGIAHAAALKRGGATVGVLGCGVDVVYPPEARSLHAAIAEGGALVSELWMGAPPDAINFPRRNRIISGLARAVIVTEAPRKSGALITARSAMDQGRDLYVVPGDITRLQAYGTNALLAEGARVIAGADDLLVNLGLVARVSTPEGDQLGLPVAPPPDIPAEERTVLDALCLEPVHVDALVTKLGREPADLLGALSMMELRGLVVSHPGSRYSRAVIAP